ncbi:hypothetical protein BKA82DRAFT_4097742 [Pisolithus tinctorius]|nr:hypothetical protein BKA82DRAFT_4097742 [Pisolithus tinctorius]
MVRQTKQTSVEKKESHKRKATPSTEDSVLKKKPTVESAVWACKISGCGKTFAREADLKRHQRTTKLHSPPSFACPQCDAAFTRTDALRRHQKSRHNGVVIEPSDPERKNGMTPENLQSSSSKPKSRSRSTSKGRDNPSAHSSVSVPQTSVPPGGPQTYYRQHTLPGMLMPCNLLVDGQYPPPIGLPTSAARLHQPPWTHPHHPPWGDGSQIPPPPPHIIAMGYPPPHPAYYPSPYYRSSTVPPHLDLVSPPLPPQHQHQSPNSAGSPHQADSSSSRTASPAVTGNVGADHGDGNSETPSTVPVIDPSLDMGASLDESCPDAKAPAALGGVVGAVLKSASENRGSSVSSGGKTDLPPPNGQIEVGDVSGDSEPSTQDGSSASTAVGGIPPTDDTPNPAYASPDSTIQYPPEMEQMLTEDGEPMLNPAELLTQESLASPSPS